MKNKKPTSLTPIRYAGGKSKYIKRYLDGNFPKEFNDFYEPFIGGGSVSLWMAQLYPEKNIIINDLNSKLYKFWKTLKEKPIELINKVSEIRVQYDNNNPQRGTDLFNDITKVFNNPNSTDFEIAVCYYVLNKISFSGLTEHGSLSKDAYKDTYSLTNIKKLDKIYPLMKNYTIMNTDYQEVCKNATEEDFIFLDPPYDIGKLSTLYGDKGAMHKGFDHGRFIDWTKTLKSKWMITYNDNERIREAYKGYKIIDNEYKYCMSFATDGETGQKTARTKNELLILNY